MRRRYPKPPPPKAPPAHLPELDTEKFPDDDTDPQPKNTTTAAALVDIDAEAAKPRQRNEDPCPAPIDLPDAHYTRRPWLKQFAFGHNGKPIPVSPGRPPKKLVIPLLVDVIGREMVSKSFRVEMRNRFGIYIPPGQTNWEALARALWQRAVRGSMEAINFIADRTEGKVPNFLDLNAHTDPAAEGNVQKMSDDQLMLIAAGGTDENEDYIDVENQSGSADTPFDGGAGTSDPAPFQE